MLTSTFGNKFSSDLGILQLMDDLGKYVGKPGYIMLGGGNPSRIPAIETYFQTALARILEDKSRFSDMISAYSGPEGDLRFRKALATFLSTEYGWPITEGNIVLTNGSQTAFFYLFNLFSGRYADGSFKKILLPLTPEYIGYGDAGITEDHFIAYRSTIDILDNRLFKYHVDFDAIEVTDEIGAICVSRPTNPTGNVLDGDEIDKLGQLAKAHHIPLIVDNAYGLPFPNIIFTDENPTWEPHMIMCMSLSKLGLPGTRTGIIIASDEVVRKMAGINAVMSLAPGNFGPAIALEAIESGEIQNLSHNLIRPHYKRKVWHAIDALREHLDGIDYYIHTPQGAIFVWIWFKGLPISSQELYEKLKERGVLVIPGQHFYPGLDHDLDWQHRYECIRMSYASSDENVEAGAKIIGEVVRGLY